MRYNNTIRLTLVGILLAAAIIALQSGRRLSLAASLTPTELAKPVAISNTSAGGSDLYPYHGTRFTSLIAESYQDGDAGDPQQFYDWMDGAYQTSGFRFPGKETLTLEALLNDRKQELANIEDPAEKTKAQIELAAWLHRLIKKTITKFSLDRGFEFYNIAKTGERQCFLQSVIISSLLQYAGVDAGEVMIYKNIEGRNTNNGHAVTLVKLADGHDIIVDASEPEPFPRQKGIFAFTYEYRYLDPVYDKDSPKIHNFRTESGYERIATARVKMLDLPFIRSQFWYYRGERAKDGVLSPHPTREGLEASQRYLETSVKVCPKNLLAVYMLGRVYLAEGSSAQSARMFEDAYKLYSRSGWVPEGPKDYLARSNRRNRSAKL